MTNQRREKRFRVSGEDADGDVHAFETDSRERAEDMKLVMEGQELLHVAMDKQTRL
ncbi:MAG: hypothetical protein JWO81_1569 [Alphaproteobacteria bacterium]|nr:hypothetical protein [Alphaproteobacteria bacterium]